MRLNLFLLSQEFCSLAETETRRLSGSSTYPWQFEPVTPLRIRSFTTLFTALVGAEEQWPGVFSHTGSPEVLQLVFQQLCLSRPGLSKRETERASKRDLTLCSRGYRGGFNKPLNQPKMKTLSSFIHTLVVSNLHESFSSKQHKRKEDMLNDVPPALVLNNVEFKTSQLWKGNKLPE